MTDDTNPHVDHDYPFETSEIEQTVRDPRPLRIRGRTYDFTNIPLPDDHVRFPYHQPADKRKRQG